MSTGVQGESLPVAAGTALHFKRSGASSIAVAYVGDGTWGEGSVYEALNLAALWELPLLVVVENNKIAQSTPTELQLAGAISKRAAAFGIQYAKVTGFEVPVIRAQLAPVLAGVRAEGGPAVIEFDTYRLGPHSKGDDTRDRATLARAQANDWYLAYQELVPELFARVDRAQHERVSRVIEDVLGRGESTWQTGE
jgi:pyruvate dehydrogenase E1 component alpha subunit